MGETARLVIQGLNPTRFLVDQTCEEVTSLPCRPVRSPEHRGASQYHVQASVFVDEADEQSGYAWALVDVWLFGVLRVEFNGRVVGDAFLQPREALTRPVGS